MQLFRFPQKSEVFFSGALRPARSLLRFLWLCHAVLTKAEVSQLAGSADSELRVIHPWNIVFSVCAQNKGLAHNYTGNPLQI